MPILNTRGDALAGIDGIVSVNGVPVSALLGITAGGWRFLTDDIIGGQAFIAGGWSLWQVDRHTSADELKQIDGAGANEFRAGAGQWLAYTVPPPLVRGTIARAAGEGRALYDMGRDGVAIIKDQQAAERGLTVVTPTGVQPYPDQIFVAYQDDHLLSVTPAHGLALTRVSDWTVTPVPDLGVRGGRICAGRDGHVYQVFYWRGYTVVQRLGGYTGWPIRFSEHDFNPDVVATGTTTLTVATSYGGGERPEQTQRYTVDLTAPPIDLRDLHPPLILPPVSDVAAVNRPTFIGPYQFNTWIEGRRR